VSNQTTTLTAVGNFGLLSKDRPELDPHYNSCAIMYGVHGAGERNRFEGPVTLLPKLNSSQILFFSSIASQKSSINTIFVRIH
jgi:hypothetical protein